MGHQIATVALGPILYLQGRAVRRRVPQLPEPEGPRSGVAGRGPELSLAIVGDSAAAGVGVDHQDEALLGNLLAELTRRNRVRWQLLARTGATTESTHGALSKLDSRPFDVVVTSLGVNDVTSGLGRREWLEGQRALRAEIRRRTGSPHLIACGLPPVHAFPALPHPLRWYLGRRARQFDEDLERDVEQEEGVSFLSLGFSEIEDGAASDGFHPGPKVYLEWGARLASLILEKVLPSRMGRSRS